MKLQEEPQFYSKGSLLYSRVLGYCRVKYIYENLNQIAVIFNHKPYGSCADAYLKYIDGKIYDFNGGEEVMVIEY